jgi:hypothetical protein
VFATDVRESIGYIGNDTLRHFVLNGKNILEVPPQLATILGVYQLHGYSYAVVSPANTSFHDISNTEFSSHSLNADGTTFVHERRRP